MSAADAVFIDTNVLVYPFDRSEPVKGAIARTVLKQLFAAGMPYVSPQVLAEFYSTLTTKLKNPVSPRDTADEIRNLVTMAQVISVDWIVIDRAIRTASTHSFSIWDAFVHAAAVSAKSSFLLTEDMQHRRVLDGVTILNPFAADFKITEILPP